MEETCNCVSLKLLIDTESQRVLFAEAGKEFIDFLLHILALPLGTFIPLFEKQGILGSFGNIYESIDNLRSIDDYLQPNVDKETILKAKVDISGVPLQLEMPNVVSSATSRKLYRCPRAEGKCDLQVAYDSTVICPLCQKVMEHELCFVDPPSKMRGYVKEVVKYMVMDDLEVKPMSTTSTFTLLNKSNVKEMGALAEKVIVLGMDEGVKLLKASLQSKSVLTDVFLPILNQEVKYETSNSQSKLLPARVKAQRRRPSRSSIRSTPPLKPIRSTPPATKSDPPMPPAESKLDPEAVEADPIHAAVEADRSSI